MDMDGIKDKDEVRDGAYWFEAEDGDVRAPGMDSHIQGRKVTVTEGS